MKNMDDASDVIAALRNLLARVDDHFGGRAEWDWKEQTDARVALAAIDALAVSQGNQP